MNKKLIKMDKKSLIKIARAQRTLIFWAVGGIVAFNLIPTFELSGLSESQIEGINSVYKVVPRLYMAILMFYIAEEMQKEKGWIYSLGGFIFWVIPALILVVDSSRALQAAGLRVGLLGVSKQDIEKI